MSNLTVCISTRKQGIRSDSEDKHNYITIPLSNEHLAFIKELYLISNNTIDLVDVTVSVTVPESNDVVDTE